MKELKETLINVIKGDKNEGTDSPYWLILDPKQNMSCDIYNLASQITGVFFSREDAQKHLTNRRYMFSKRAKVFCLSGYWSNKYKNTYKSLEKEHRNQ